MSKSGAPDTIGNRVAPARFILFVLLFAAATGAAGAAGRDAAQAVMAGFDLAAALFLLACLPLMRSEAQAMRDQAARNDANRVTLLAITGVVMAAILVAVGSELGQPSLADKALILGTLTLAWLFSNTVYALHYAHLYYLSDGGGGDTGGIGFPDTDEPDYPDFLYFAFTLGMTFQTSDVEIRDRRIRRVVVIHCLAAFLFNLGVIAFTINVIGG